MDEHKSLLIALVAGLVVAAIGIMVAQGRTQRGIGTRPPVKSTPQNNIALVRGRLSIAPASGRQIYEPKEGVVLEIKGDSDGRAAVGFDAVLTIDNAVLAFSQAASKIPSFDIFNNVNDKRVYLGGIKKVDTKDTMVFANTPLAEVTFKALQKGYSPVTFIFIPQDTTESNIVLSTSKDGLAEVQGTDIYVGSKIILNKVSSKTSAPITLPGTTMKLQLKDIVATSATLDLQMGTQIATKTFTWGSDTTLSSNLENAFGYLFQAVKGQNNSVVVYYAAQK